MSAAERDHANESGGNSGKRREHGRRDKEEAGKPVGDCGELRQLLPQCQHGLAAGVLKRMRHLMSGGGGGQRSAVMAPRQQAHHLGVGIVMVAPVGNLDGDPLKVESLDQVLGQFSAGTGKIVRRTQICGPTTASTNAAAAINSTAVSKRRQARRSSVNWAPVALVQFN